VPRFDPKALVEPVFVVGSQLVNIGAHGVMLEAPVPLETDSTLRFRLVVGGRKAEVEGRVCACVPRVAGRQWGVGIEFVRMSDAARQRLDLALLHYRRGTA
jgi:hypothetical protein